MIARICPAISGKAIFPLKTPPPMAMLSPARRALLPPMATGSMAWPAMSGIGRPICFASNPCPKPARPMQRPCGDIASSRAAAFYAMPPIARATASPRARAIPLRAPPAIWDFASLLTRRPGAADASRSHPGPMAPPTVQDRPAIHRFAPPPAALPFRHKAPAPAPKTAAPPAGHPV
jgi:hypothetical protein